MSARLREVDNKQVRQGLHTLQESGVAIIAKEHASGEGAAVQARDMRASRFGTDIGDRLGTDSSPTRCPVPR